MTTTHTPESGVCSTLYICERPRKEAVLVKRFVFAFSAIAVGAGVLSAGFQPAGNAQQPSSAGSGVESRELYDLADRSQRSIRAAMGLLSVLVVRRHKLAQFI
jgi:hypothetical protein